MLRDEGRRSAEEFLTAHSSDLGARSNFRHRRPARPSLKHDGTGRYTPRFRPARLAVPIAAGAFFCWRRPPPLIAAAAAGEPLLAHWTQTFMGSAAQFLAQFFPLFLLGALFGKLMEDSGSVEVIAGFMTETLGTGRAVLAVVLAGAIVTYGGVSLFVAIFVLVPMAQGLFRAADIPRRIMPAAIALGTMTFTMSALPGTPALQNAIPMPFFGTTPFAAPGLGVIAAAIMLAFGLAWLARVEGAARRAGEGFGEPSTRGGNVTELPLRDHASLASEFDPAELFHGSHTAAPPAVFVALLPLVVVIFVNLVMSVVVLPVLDTSFLAEEKWGGTTLAAVGGVSGGRGRAAGRHRDLDRPQFLPAPGILRDSMDAGATASVLPALSVASLVGFGAVIAALPAFAMVRDFVLSIEGGPLVSLAVATNILAALTGSASGGLTIALDALGETYLKPPPSRTSIPRCCTASR